MDDDQKIILYVYSLYTSEDRLNYLQYTAALAIFFYLMKKGYFPNYQYQLLHYDYKDVRRYLWEDKKFMDDINVVRDKGFIVRSRVKTIDYRDINAHQCTIKGERYLRENGIKEINSYEKILNELRCRCGKLLRIQLDDDSPYLRCVRGCMNIKISGFLSEIDLRIDESGIPAFI